MPKPGSEARESVSLLTAEFAARLAFHEIMLRMKIEIPPGKSWARIAAWLMTIQSQNDRPAQLFTLCYTSSIPRRSYTRLGDSFWVERSDCNLEQVQAQLDLWKRELGEVGLSGKATVIKLVHYRAFPGLGSGERTLSSHHPMLLAEYTRIQLFLGLWKELQASSTHRVKAPDVSVVYERFGSFIQHRSNFWLDLMME